MMFMKLTQALPFIEDFLRYELRVTEESLSCLSSHWWRLNQCVRTN